MSLRRAITVVLLACVAVATVAAVAVGASSKPPQHGIETYMTQQSVVVPDIALDYGLSAPCDVVNGWRATGGGGSIDRLLSGVISTSQPLAIAGVDDAGWLVRYRGMDASFAGATITAWAVCARYF